MQLKIQKQNREAKMQMEQWDRKESRTGQYGSFLINGLKFIGPQDQTGWKVSLHTDRKPVRSYLVVGSVFMQIIPRLWDPATGGSHSYMVSKLDEDMEAKERAVIMEAINDWEKRNTLDVEVLG